MAQLTFNPVAGANSPCDGIATRESQDQTFGNIRAGAGNNARTNNVEESIGLNGSTTSNQFEGLYRMICNFNTAALGAGSTITSATLSLYVIGTNNGLGTTNFTFEIVGATPGATNTIANSDYGQLGSTSFASTAFGSITTGAFNDFTLNPSGLANISKTGVSSFGLKSGWDLNNSFDGLWASGGLTRYRVEMADNASNLPKLVVNYILGNTNSRSFFM